MKRAFGLAMIVIAGLSVASAQEAPATGAAGRGGPGGPPPGQLVWAPKAAKLNPWVAPHKAHTKLADVLAAHKGQADWTEQIVDDDNLNAAYISMGPGRDPATKMITLEDGTQLSVAADAKMAGTPVKEGSTVKASYDEKDGKKVITQIEVKN